MTLLEGVMWIIYVYVHHKEFFSIFSVQSQFKIGIQDSETWGEGSGGLGD